jgi:NADH-quinone oxidoreductase subunit L
MGGLRKYMPLTFGTFLIGYLAISGVPPFAGFFSKDEILWEAFNRQLAVPGLSMALYILGLLGAGITAFYMTRLMVLAFAGAFRGDSQQAHHLHEAPAIMTLPLVVLALLSAVGGVIGLPELTHLPKLLHRFLSPVLGAAEVAHPTTSANAMELLLILISIVVAFSGIFMGWLFYVKRPELPGLVSARFCGLYRLIAQKFYVDEIYHTLFVRPVLKLAALSGRFDLQGIDAVVNLSSRLTAKVSILVGWEDLQVVDGAVNGLATLVQNWGARLQRLQTGKVQHYLYSVVLGLFVLYVILQLT